MDTAKLLALGNEWRKDDKHRIYFNDLPRWYGLTVDKYKSGNISSAAVDGVPLSNGKAKVLLNTLQYGKVWFDVPTGNFQSSALDPDIATKIIAAIVQASE